MEHPRLVDDLLQDVSDAGGEDEQRDAVLVQVVEEELVALPVERHAAALNALQLNSLKTLT